MSVTDQIGQKVDERLEALGIKLTQGGEPTFVPRMPVQPEWNTEALGPEKLPYARRLAAGLLQSLFPGSAVLKVQGKHYPGEPLPRWSLSLFRLKNSKPLWKDPNRLLLREDQHSKKVSPTVVERFFPDLCKVLKTDDRSTPAYEDLSAWLHRYHPREAGSIRPEVHRAVDGTIRIPSIDCTRLDGWDEIRKPCGQVLPLDFIDGQWKTERWEIPGEKEISLIPGDSPVGLRLPLGRLPQDAIRRAVTVEIKEGELVVFLPPLPSVEAFVQMLAAIEKVVSKKSYPPIVLEGYAPPHDPRIESLSLTSDPGVIEVNLPPARDFRELSLLTNELFDAAEDCGLCGHKHQFNGRTTGTGGGAHILLGGPSLSENPFVLRPQLLAGILRFLNRHPALSYVFTGNFMGPSCQAPRPDESARGTTDELEIALRALESGTGAMDPDFIDRLLRSLLLDWNGNTHRAEICLDKFCNPLTPNGRLGVIEFRAIEMLPEREWVLSVNLFLRALVLALAEKPFTKTLKQWGEPLHDQFLLPGVMAGDLEEACRYLQHAGVEWPSEWFEAIVDFRFPVLHAWKSNAVQFELRQALEIWPALGADGGGTSRKVDASTDRVQVKLSGKDMDRFAVVVNGWEVPLQSMPDGSRIAGMRFKAYSTDHALHPHIQPHVPLLIDIIDRRTGKCLHGFKYSTWKLDEGFYDGLPGDRAQADGRVRERSRELPDRTGLKPPYKTVAAKHRKRFTFDLRLAAKFRSISA